MALSYMPGFVNRLSLRGVFCAGLKVAVCCGGVKDRYTSRRYKAQRTNSSWEKRRGYSVQLCLAGNLVDYATKAETTLESTLTVGEVCVRE